MKVKNLLFILLLFFIIIVPVGLISQNPAWGEWSKEYFKKLLGFIPKGIENSKEIVKPLLPDYSLDGKSEIISYYVSAILGVILIFAFFYGLKIFLKRKKQHEA